jgi:hypothetical protein
MIKNMPGVKPEELEWLGLEDWLKEQKGSITKDQIADYVRANRIGVTEVTKGNRQVPKHKPRLPRRRRTLTRSISSSGCRQDMRCGNILMLDRGVSSIRMEQSSPRAAAKRTRLPTQLDWAARSALAPKGRSFVN